MYWSPFHTWLKTYNMQKTRFRWDGNCVKAVVVFALGRSRFSIDISLRALTARRECLPVLDLRTYRGYLALSISDISVHLDWDEGHLTFCWTAEPFAKSTLPSILHGFNSLKLFLETFPTPFARLIPLTAVFSDISDSILLQPVRALFLIAVIQGDD